MIEGAHVDCDVEVCLQLWDTVLEDCVNNEVARAVRREEPIFSETFLKQNGIPYFEPALVEHECRGALIQQQDAAAPAEGEDARLGQGSRSRKHAFEKNGLWTGALPYLWFGTATGPVRKAPSNLFTIWVCHNTPIYFLCNYF